LQTIKENQAARRKGQKKIDNPFVLFVAEAANEKL
jgi:hypothetical protein